MRLSSLVVASILLFSTSLLAQHSVTGSTSNSSSSSASSSHVSSPNPSASHSSSSGPSSSASHSAGAHNSSASDPHNSSAGSAATRSSARSGNVVRKPNKTGEQGNSTAQRSKKPQPEHKGTFSFLHRRSRKPAPKVVEQPVEAERRRRACPPGQAAGKQGGCIAGTATTASTQCPPNAYGVGGPCANKTDQCASFRGQLDAAAAELRNINAEMRMAGCSGSSAAQECAFLLQRREAALARYRALQGGIPPNCTGTLPDPLSL